MKAVILAAGIGSRLRPITNDKPKTLVEVNNKPMLDYIIESINSAGIKDIILCIGYKATKIINHCETKYPNLNFIYVENKEYECTNNMYSLFLARDFLNEDILLMNADLVFDNKILSELILEKTSSVAVDKGKYLEESMKVIVENSYIKGISKKISPQESYGCSIDVYKIVEKDLDLIKQEMHNIINVQKNRNQWTEVTLDNLFREGKLIAKPLNIKGKKWFEIDDFEDLGQAEILFNRNIDELKDKKVFFIDRDGTITLGNEIIPGVDKFISKLRQKNKKFYVLTNNSSRTPKEHFEKLKEIGLEITEDNILVSIQSALTYLQKKEIKDIYFVANTNVSNYILEQGFNYNDKDPQALLLTYDDELTYEKLRKFVILARKGIPYYATHSDIVCPTPNGDIPDIGTFIKIIEMSNGLIPNKIFGKPDKNIIDGELQKYDFKEKDVVIIGDRLYTDIKLAENSDITSILVLSGETKREDYENSSVRANIVVSNLDVIVDYL